MNRLVKADSQMELVVLRRTFLAFFGPFSGPGLVVVKAKRPPRKSKAVLNVSIDIQNPMLKYSLMTVGEETFARYLDARGIRYEFEKLPPGKTRPPDYTILHDREYLLEVKDFDPTEIPKGWTHDPYLRIREKIDRARKKFREYEGWPCALVLYNNDAPLVHLREPDFVLGAMYGDAGIVTPFDAKTGEAVGEGYPAFLGRGKMTRPHWREPENTRISAIITLRYVYVGSLRLKKFVSELKSKETGRVERATDLLRQLRSADLNFDREEKHLGVIVWENAFAAIPFPRDLFTGNYDELYGVVDGRQPRIFAGQGIMAYEELAASINTPSIFDRMKKKK